MWIGGCSAVHTMMMRATIDLYFLDKEKRVLKIAAAVAPGKLSISCRGAKSVLELGVAPEAARHCRRRSTGPGMNRALAIVRVALYAGFAAGAAFSPDIPATIALLGPTHATLLTANTTPDDSAVATLGWMATWVATTLAGWFDFPGLAFANALAIAGTLALVEWRARRVSSPVVALAAAVIAAACSLEAVHIGGGAANGMFFAALLVALDFSGTAGLIAIAIVTALWCNVSAAGVLAPMFAIAYALGNMADRASRSERVRSQLAALVCALATLATPCVYRVSAPGLARDRNR